ncbi:MAG: PEP-CTERM sorting domain-containing protein [Lentisphaeria bacterium]
MGNTDLFLGTIDSPLSSAYNYYNFATEDINNTTGDWGSSSYNGDNAYVFGKSPNSWPTSQNMAVGRNVLDRFFLGTTDNTRTGDAIGANYDTGDVSYETMLEPGDSGGPLFVDDGAGNLKLVGVNWFIDDSDTEDFFGATYLGNYDTEVQSFIDTYTIPEPVTLIPLLLVSAFLALSRRR